MEIATSPEIRERLADVSRRRHEEQHERRARHFVKGPIPVNWLARAAIHRGKALAVGLAVWHCAGLKKRRDCLALCPKMLARFGIARQAGYRGLRALESANLVRVDRGRGRCPRVSIVLEGA
jgi:hypothetical protein